MTCLCRLCSWPADADQADGRPVRAGTPLQNDLGELFSLLNLLMPRVFSCSAEFQAFFDAPAAGTSAEDRAHLLSEEQSLLVANRFHAILAPFMLRRLKAQVLADVPAKVHAGRRGRHAKSCTALLPPVKACLGLDR